MQGNGDWLPIQVPFNKERNIFEGQDSISKTARLQINAGEMTDLMSGIGDAHAGFIKKI